MLDNPLYSLAGLLVGVLVGLTGVGGGSLMTPLLVLMFGFHPATAVGTDLLFASVTKTVGTAVHHKGRTVEWPIVFSLGIGSVPAAMITLLLMHRYGFAGNKSPGFLSFLLGGALLLTAIAVLVRPWILKYAGEHIEAMDSRRATRWTVALGALLGVLVSLTSVGAGALGTTALLILYPKLPIARIAGSDIAHAVPLTLIAGLGHWWIGSVDFALMGALLLGSIPGVIVGSLLAARASDSVLRPVLGITLLIVSIRLLMS
ncbi:sulfite exporter TauE/SafE family protein [Sphingomonas sabuli]|uniref:Probable membrane transporter protein n=1 Tax=Sphingomonas sabuli TaxID=2764186 RepID=A0A7G9L2Y3_9SPHN|nr:sulfite exporter TauE/SafE family protein [Sphingomonas sabuli]QNM82982.1 sulfite exporter TauE/SafE family protein [Sphingomonas sabuli]